jgi:galactitol-specific phosphotransferase system IIB component
LIDKGGAAPTKGQPQKALAAKHNADVTTIDELNAIIAAADLLVPGAKLASSLVVCARAMLHPSGKQHGSPKTWD